MNHVLECMHCWHTLATSIVLALLVLGCVQNAPEAVSNSSEPLEAGADENVESANVGPFDSTPTEQDNAQIVSRQEFRKSPEIPTLAERQTLPDCEGVIFSVLPVDLKEVDSITPLGNLGPPGHTFPTEHVFFHFNSGDASTELFSLHAPADVYITSISGGSGLTQDPFDYTIYFALCKDVIGYYNHVKELSPALEKVKSSGTCQKNPGTSYEYCENKLDLVKAGAEMGKVGRLQGNFDFGLVDLRIQNQFAKPERYGIRSLHIQCPFDYYGDELKQVFFAKIERNDANQCGTVAQDVPGTLQGNWFFQDARADSGSDWDKYLAFVYDNLDPSLQVVSIGGTFTSAGTWTFSPSDNGTVNRSFSQVVPDGKTYCFEGTGQSGIIVVQMVGATELKIERQNGSCSSTMSFQKPYSYTR